MSYSEFCQKFSTEMLMFDPRNNFYNRDDILHSFPQNHKTRRKINKNMNSCEQLNELYPEYVLTKQFQEGQDVSITPVKIGQ